MVSELHPGEIDTAEAIHNSRFAGVDFLESATREACRPRSADPPWRWAEQHFEVERSSPFKGHFKIENSPWLKEPTECYADPYTREMTCMCSRQSSKTTLGMILAAWSVDQSPHDTLWAMSTIDVAKKFTKGRFQPVLDQCAPVLAHSTGERHDKSLLSITFDNMLLSFGGSNSLASLQSYPYARLFLDELGEWKNHESLPTAEQSISAHWDGKIFKIGTPEEVGDPLDESYQTGDRREFNITLPCGHEQPMAWEFIAPDGSRRGMRWDKNDTTFDGEKYIFPEIAKTVRYECTVCGAPFRDHMQQRRQMASAGRYIRTNPSAPAGIVSFHWNALIVPWIRFDKLVEEFLRARQLVKVGSVKALKRFITGRLAEPWEDRRLHDGSAKPIALADYRKSDALPPEYKHRVAFIDVQNDHCWMVVMAFRDDCHNRTLYEGKVSTFDGCHEIQTQFKVLGGAVGVDVAYELRAIETRQAAAKFGWNTFKEENRRPYAWPLPPVAGQPKQFIQRIYSQRQLVPIGSGPMRVRRDDGNIYHVEAVPMFYWVRNDTFDIVKRWQETGAIEIPADVSKDYLDHNSALVKTLRTDDRTGRRVWKYIERRPRFDLFICVAGCAVIASMLGLVTIDETDTNKPAEAGK